MAFQDDTRVFGKGEQEVRVVLDGGDKLIQTLKNRGSGKLIGRIPAVRGSFILCGRAASTHSPDCTPAGVPLRGKMR